MLKIFNCSSAYSTTPPSNSVSSSEIDDIQCFISRKRSDKIDSKDIVFYACSHLHKFRPGSIEELKTLLKRKNEWFIQKEISELYQKQNQIEKAIAFAVDSAVNFGDPDKKMNLYKLLAELLKAQNKISETKTHIELIYKIKSTNQWEIDSKLLDLVSFYNIDTNNIPDVKELLRGLKQIWENLKFGNQELLKGIIKTIIVEGKAGFIEMENRKSYFFSTKDFKGRRDLIQQGQKVSFFLADSFDKKKNQPSKIDVNVKPMK